WSNPHNRVVPAETLCRHRVLRRIEPSLLKAYDEALPQIDRALANRPPAERRRIDTQLEKAFGASLRLSCRVYFAVVCFLIGIPKFSNGDSLMKVVLFVVDQNALYFRFSATKFLLSRWGVSIVRELGTPAWQFAFPPCEVGMRRVVWGFLAVILLASLMTSQDSRASLGGQVMDPQGAVIPGAEVVVRSDDTGVSQQTRVNERGNWTVRFLLPGRYSITVTMAGFTRAERHGITLQTADSKQIDITLDLGTV